MTKKQRNSFFFWSIEVYLLHPTSLRVWALPRIYYLVGGLVLACWSGEEREGNSNWWEGWGGQCLKYTPLSTHPASPLLSSPSFHLFLLSSFSVYASDTCHPLNGHTYDPSAPLSKMTPQHKPLTDSKQIVSPIIWPQAWPATLTSVSALAYFQSGLSFFKCQSEMKLSHWGEIYRE